MDWYETIQTKATDKSRHNDINSPCLYHIRPGTSTYHGIFNDINPAHHQPCNRPKWRRGNRFWMAFLEEGARIGNDSSFYS